MPSDKSLRRRSRSNSRSERRERSLSRDRSADRRRRRQKYRRRSRSSSSSCSRRTRSPDNYRHRRRSNSRQDRSASRYKRTHGRRSPTPSSESDSDSSVKSNTSSLENKKKPENKPSFDLGSLDIDQQAKKDFIEHINSECFLPKNFVSSTKKMPDKVIIDLHNETISVTPPTRIEKEDDNICHPNFCGDQNHRMEKWVRKMFNFRQKCFQE